jgi:DNA polymerase-3 subunit alpha
MAALMTSFIENAGKVSECINVCRNMGIEILPPDVNAGEATFTVRDGKICYALTAIKSIGRPVIDALVRERELNGPYKSLTDLASRMSGYDFNKRAMENLIKAGALDSLGGTRKQYMSIYMSVMDGIAQGRRQVSGQISLMDFMGDHADEEFKETLPPVGEYVKESKLAFEKEVLGIYVSGHPLEDYRKLLKNSVTATAADFMLDPDADTAKIEDGKRVVIGGMITSKTVKYTKTNRAMAFITLEDLYGAVEVIVFPNDYDRYGRALTEDAKVIIEGKTSVEEDKDGKLILEKLTPFEDIPREVWVRFKDRASYDEVKAKLDEIVKRAPGHDTVVVFLADTKQMQRLPGVFTDADAYLVDVLKEAFGPDNIQVMQTPLISQKRR